MIPQGTDLVAEAGGVATEETCCVCGGPGDAVFIATFGPSMNPGRRALRIALARHAMTGMQATGLAMLDDNDEWRCVTCLEVVPADRIKYMLGHGRARIKRTPLVTGNERLCCGRAS